MSLPNPVLPPIRLHPSLPSPPAPAQGRRTPTLPSIAADSNAEPRRLNGSANPSGAFRSKLDGINPIPQTQTEVDEADWEQIVTLHYEGLVAFGLNSCDDPPILNLIDLRRFPDPSPTVGRWLDRRT